MDTKQLHSTRAEFGQFDVSELQAIESVAIGKLKGVSLWSQQHDRVVNSSSSRLQLKASRLPIKLQQCVNPQYCFEPNKCLEIHAKVSEFYGKSQCTSLTIPHAFKIIST